MKLVRKPWIWVSRFRNRKGYGVHSPFAYSFIRGVVLETTPYYAYSELAQLHPWWVRWGRMYPLSCRQLLFRLANFAEPKTVVLLTEDEVAKKYVRAAVPRAEIISAGKPLSTNTGRGKGDTKRERMEREEREREMEKREGKRDGKGEGKRDGKGGGKRDGKGEGKRDEERDGKGEEDSGEEDGGDEGGVRLYREGISRGSGEVCGGNAAARDDGLRGDSWEPGGNGNMACHSSRSAHRNHLRPLHLRRRLFQPCPLQAALQSEFLSIFVFPGVSITLSL